MGEIAMTIIVAVITSNALLAFMQYLITRYDTKKNVKGKLLALEKDVLRTQLLLLILMRPEEKQEIMTVGEHYFKDLKGDWYMTSIFNKWLTENNYAEPDWFEEE